MLDDLCRYIYNLLFKYVIQIIGFLPAIFKQILCYRVKKQQLWKLLYH